MTVQPIGTHEGAVLLYMAPAKSASLCTEDQFRAALASYRERPWIWIFDGGGCGAAVANIGFCKSMYKILDTEHKQSLQAVWILNLNSWLRGVIQLFPASKPTLCLPKERLEMFVEMQRKGLSSSVIDILIGALQFGSR
jgi:hypothetical protein